MNNKNLRQNNNLFHLSSWAFNIYTCKGSSRTVLIPNDDREIIFSEGINKFNLGVLK